MWLVGERGWIEIDVWFNQARELGGWEEEVESPVAAAGEQMSAPWAANSQTLFIRHQLNDDDDDGVP